MEYPGLGLAYNHLLPVTVGQQEYYRHRGHRGQRGLHLNHHHPLFYQTGWDFSPRHLQKRVGL